MAPLFFEKCFFFFLPSFLDFFSKPAEEKVAMIFSSLLSTAVAVVLLSFMLPCFNGISQFASVTAAAEQTVLFVQCNQSKLINSFIIITFCSAAGCLCRTSRRLMWSWNSPTVFAPLPPPFLSGRPVQPDIHHGPGGLRPRVALHRRRRGHVHPGLRRLHRRPPREHLPAQICKPCPSSPGQADTSRHLPTPARAPRFTPGLKIRRAASSREGVNARRPAPSRDDTLSQCPTKSCSVAIEEKPTDPFQRKQRAQSEQTMRSLVSF